MADIRAAEATVREWERVGKIAREALTDARVEAADLQARIDAALALIDEFRGGRPVPPTSMAALVRAALTGEEVVRG